jgi:RNA recognition motif-containing protein
MIAEAKGANKKGKYESALPEDNPPRSRLFFVCGREQTEEELIEKFKQFGTVDASELEYCKLMKDKNTGESKGCGFAKFTKASTAALVMEKMNENNEESKLYRS